MFPTCKKRVSHVIRGIMRYVVTLILTTLSLLEGCLSLSINHYLTTLLCHQGMQHEMMQKSEQHAAPMEASKLRKKTDDPYRDQQPESVSQTAEEAVHRDKLARNKYVSALEESEQVTSKMKGKREVRKVELHSFVVVVIFSRVPLNY